MGRKSRDDVEVVGTMRRRTGVLIGPWMNDIGGEGSGTRFVREYPLIRSAVPEYAKDANE